MNKTIRITTDYLFPSSDFITGLASVFNLPGNFYDFNTSQSAHEADNKALQNDWMMVGQDILDARDKFEEENNIPEEVLCD